ncbi:rhodanese-like domain-containing protein [Tropicimonas sp. TH_r6]|uniref:rhodanese-like domain-containing protein n=1 Tax=Tropicimonas sp. TH_r6 TaxID=3082085 RepID=UPI00295351A7|nr:rhodanese-like domain-containing protein [Tropicimonas sp. TH_r6]MDV7142599.1 rhodanese-like domain-containing protein [Tropicimonas sp. TH_r6]
MKRFFSTIAFCAAAFSLQMAQAADLPASKQTKLGLYLSAEEAAQYLAETPDAIMIDVRTPEEIAETGLAEEVDALIPLAIVDRKKGLISNPDFYPGIVKLATDHNLAADQPIVVICRSGNRSAQAANAIAQLGFRQVYSVTDGYEGDRARSGPTAGKRTVNGWKNAGLPWRPEDPGNCAPARDGGAC